MIKFWVIVFDDGESWQEWGELKDVLKDFQEKGHTLNFVIGIVSHD